MTLLRTLLPRAAALLAAASACAAMPRMRFQTLRIPVGAPRASGFCRGQQHAQAMFGRYDTDAALSPPASYPAVTVLVSHGINAQLLTGDHPDVRGEAVTFRPDGRASYARVATVLPHEW